VTSQAYVININDPCTIVTLSAIPYLKILYPQSARGASHHAWAPGPPPSKPSAVAMWQTWGNYSNYSTNVIDYDYDYLPPAGLGLRINKIAM